MVNDGFRSHGKVHLQGCCAMADRGEMNQARYTSGDNGWGSELVLLFKQKSDVQKKEGRRCGVDATARWPKM